MPKYSIITPCYKCAKYIRETLDSVLAQRVQDWELICVDDGSPDETGAMLDGYLREHCAVVAERQRVIKAIGDEDSNPDSPKRILVGEFSSGARMMVVHQMNCGVSGARNTAMTLATGEWLIYLDGDDLLAPEALEVIEDCRSKAQNVDVVECGDLNFNDGEGVSWGTREARAALVDVSKTIPFDAFIGCFQRFSFRRELVKDIAFRGVSCTEELGYVIRCFIRASNMAKTGDAFYGYRVLAGSMSRRSMALNRCLDAYDATRSVTRLIFDSGKSVSSSQYRGLMNRWTEMQIDLISLLSTQEERDRAWDYWWEKLPRIRRYKSVCTRWQRFAACCCMSFRSRWLAYLLFYIPHFLKQKGLHR